MTSLLHPSAAARIKAAFDTYELVARTMKARRGLDKPKPKAAPARGPIVYERGAVRVAAERR